MVCCAQPDFCFQWHLTQFKSSETQAGASVCYMHSDLSLLSLKIFIAPQQCPTDGLAKGLQFEFSSSTSNCCQVLHGFLKAWRSYVRDQETGHLWTLYPNVVLLSDHYMISKVIFGDRSINHTFYDLSPLQKPHYLLQKCQPNNMKWYLPIRVRILKITTLAINQFYVYFSKCGQKYSTNQGKI